MRISLKVEYACRVLAQLGRFHGTARLCHIEDLANAENVPSNYLVQILNELRNGGLITSKRGKQGGYSLADAPESISLLRVMEVMDPEMVESPVSGQGDSGEAVRAVWQQLTEAFNEKAAALSLRDCMATDGGMMYYI